MNAFKGRYFVPISLVFLTFSAIYAQKINFIFFPIFAISLGVIYAIFRKKRERGANFNTVILLLLIASALGTVRATSLVICEDAIAEKYSGEHTVGGYVCDIAQQEDYYSVITLRAENIDGENVNFKINAVAELDLELERGDFVELGATLISREAYKRENSDIYTEITEPIVAMIKSREDVVMCESEFRPTLVLISLNSSLSTRLRSVLGDEKGRLASALLLGNRDLLPRKTLRDFRRSGVYHILALSGMHVAILIGFLEFVLHKVVGVPKRARMVILAACSLFYVALTGFVLSACRAMLMLWTVYVAYLLGRRGDSITSLCAAVSVIVLISPRAILDAGLLLSFAATFGVIASAMIAGRLGLNDPPTDRGAVRNILSKVGRRIISSLLATLCATTCTLPIVCSLFGELSLATFLSNLIVGFLCECFMILSLISLPLPWIAPIPEIASALGGSMLDSCAEISSWRGVVISTNYPFIEALSYLTLAITLVLFGIKLKKLRHLAVPITCFAVILAASIGIARISAADTVRADYVSSKSGDAVVLSANEAYVCDASNGRLGTLYDAIETVRKRGFCEVEGVVLTHYHSYHAITLARLCADFKMYRIYVPIPQNDAELTSMRGIARMLEGSGTEIYLFRPDEPLDLLGGELEISERAYSSGYSHPSVALSFTFGESKLALIERPSFGTYLEDSGELAKYLANATAVIFGSDGTELDEKFEVADLLPDKCEICFSDFELLELSDLKYATQDREIYFGVEYREFVLKWQK